MGVTIGKWRDEHDDGTWVWTETYFLLPEWMQTLGSLLGHHTRGSN